MTQRVYLLPVEPRIVELLGATILGDSVPADWQAVAADVGILRRMREAFLAGRPYAHEISKPPAWGDEVTALSGGAEPRAFEGQALAEVYGQLLGSTLGRLLGLTLPSWSLGAGYSLGLLLAAELSPFQLLPLSGARRLRARLARLGETP